VGYTEQGRASIVALCPCGNPLPPGHGTRRRYCSNPCKYRFRVQPKRGKGTYHLTKPNPTSYRPGGHSSPATEFQPGQVPHNFAGDAAGYDSLHDWVVARLGKAAGHTCAECGEDGTTHRLEWANRSHQYRRDLDDWVVLCRPCHVAYDRESDWGAATRLFLPRASGGLGVRR